MIKISLNYKNTDMLKFYDEYYRDLAQEICSQTLDGSGTICGAVELNYGKLDIIFGFDYQNDIVRWMLLCFENNVRCSSDFRIEELEKWL